LYFVANTCPWISYEFHATPLSKINDGQNDILYLTAANGGTCRLGRILIVGEEGNYFAEDGAVRNDLGAEYVKCQSWELYPRVKGQPPLDDSVAFHNTADQIEKRGSSVDIELQQDQEVEYNDNAILSIDGERYKA